MPSLKTVDTPLMMIVGKKWMDALITALHLHSGIYASLLFCLKI